MKKFILPILAVILILAIQIAPITAQAEGAAAPARPYGTATPRDWEKHAPDGELKQTSVKAESAILMEEKTGKILFEKNVDTKQYPASITKIMTCLLAVEYLESGHKKTELVTVGTLPKLESGATTIGLKKGETMSLWDMMNGLMIKSGNDAAIAIGVHIAGSLQEFVDKMNTRAQELGMTGTHFMNPHGLHDEEHYTTARDMAILAREARRHPFFTDIVDTPSYKYAATNMRKADSWVGHNKLIDDSKGNAYGYIYATGIKTGFTSKALSTFVSSAKKENVSLITVVLKDGTSEKWTDSITMFEYGFNFYDTLDLKKLLTGQVLEPLDVKNAAGTDPGLGKLQLTMLPKTTNAYITDRKEIIDSLRNDPSQFVPNLQFTKDTAPIAKDEVVGTVSFTYNESVVFECDLLASREVKEMPTPAPTTAPATTAGTKTDGSKPSSNNATSLPGSPTEPGTESGGGSLLIWAGVALLALILAALAVRLINMQRRNRKHRQYNYRSKSAKPQR